MESRRYNFEFAASNEHHGLEKLITKAEQRYTEVGSELAKHFITQFQKAKHPIKGLLRQRDIFEKQVKPHLGEGKVAYVWVDALRFEMARELCRLLEGRLRVGHSACHRHDAHDHRNRHGGVAAEGQRVRQGGGGGRRQTGAGDRRQGHQGSQGSGGLPEGTCRRVGLRRQAGRPASQASQEGQGRHSERSVDPDHVAGDRRTRRGRQHGPSPAPDGRRAESFAARRAGAGRSRHQDHRPGRRPRPSVCRRDRRGHEDRGPRWQGRRPASPGLGGRWGNFGTLVSADVAGFVGSGQRIRHCDPVDLRLSSSRRVAGEPISTADCLRKN